jgi:RNA-binding protein
LGHHLKVVVQVGKTGVTPGVIAATKEALKTHELVKVKIEAEKEDREEALAQLAKDTGADIAQALGKTALLFKQRKNKPKIKLDAPAKPAKGDVVAKAKVDDAHGEEENVDDDDDSDDVAVDDEG